MRRRYGTQDGEKAKVKVIADKVKGVVLGQRRNAAHGFVPAVVATAVDQTD